MQGRYTRMHARAHRSVDDSNSNGLGVLTPCSAAACLFFSKPGFNESKKTYLSTEYPVREYTVQCHVHVPNVQLDAVQRFFKPDVILPAIATCFMQHSGTGNATTASVAHTVGGIPTLNDE